MSEFDLVAPGTKGTAGRTLSDAVYQRIYERISNGEWPKGTRLLTEIELAEQFGVSRTVIREALLRLRIDGLIASRHSHRRASRRAGRHPRLRSRPCPGSHARPHRRRSQTRVCRNQLTEVSSACRRPLLE